MQVFRDFESALCLGEAAVALGFFDGVHLGHRKVVSEMVEHSRACGLVPVVFTFSAEECAAVKPNSKAIYSDEVKISFFEELGVEAVFMPEFALLKNLTPEQFLKEILLCRLCAKALFCGEDFRFGTGGSGNALSLKAGGEKAGVDVRVLPFVTANSQKISSGYLRELLAGGELEQFRRESGGHYFIDFVVASGEQIGRKLGYPTINQRYPSHIALPAFGVYASQVLVGGRLYNAVTNVGIKPTVGRDEAPAAETYLFDFSGNLYNQRVKTVFYKLLRPEQKFANIEELKAQIVKDAEAARVYLEKIDKK